MTVCPVEHCDWDSYYLDTHLKEFHNEEIIRKTFVRIVENIDGNIYKLQKEIQASGDGQLNIRSSIPKSNAQDKINLLNCVLNND